MFKTNLKSISIDDVILYGFSSKFSNNNSYSETDTNKADVGAINDNVAITRTIQILILLLLVFKFSVSIFSLFLLLFLLINLSNFNKFL